MRKAPSNTRQQLTPTILTSTGEVLNKELQMNFTISGEDFIFTLLVDPDGKLNSFTAEKDSTTYDCSIQVSVSTALMPERSAVRPLAARQDPAQPCLISFGR